MSLRSLFILNFIIVLLIAACVSCSNAVSIDYSDRCCQQNDSLFFLRVKYPEFIGSGKYEKMVCDSINIIVNELVQELINDLESDLLEGDCLNNTMAKKVKWELIVDYDLVIYPTHLISTRFTIFLYHGQSHGITSFKNINYKIDPFKHLCIGDVAYVKEKAELIALNKLLHNYIKDPEECYHTKPYISDSFESFSFEKEFMVFSFPDTWKDEYVCGPLVVRIPLCDLKRHGLLKKW